MKQMNQLYAFQLTTLFSIAERIEFKIFRQAELTALSLASISRTQRRMRRPPSWVRVGTAASGTCELFWAPPALPPPRLSELLMRRMVWILMVKY
jgi:hypothetical protein